MIGTCSKCKEKCLVLTLPVMKYVVKPKQVSNCCGAPLVNQEGPERDEIETPGGKLPYRGPR